VNSGGTLKRVFELGGGFGIRIAGQKLPGLQNSAIACSADRTDAATHYENDNVTQHRERLLNFYILKIGIEMIDPSNPIILQLTKRIKVAADPERIILFGSRARGTGRSDSDYDLLVIKHSDEPRYRRSAPIYRALANLPVEVEIIVYTPEEVHQWSGVPQSIVTTAIREGTVLYEK
jgi:predicted nucleotidyltransferase